jgi:hypothetical protein
MGYVKCGKSEAHALDLAAENYMLGNLVHRGFYINSKQPSIQAGVDEKRKSGNQENQGVEYQESGCQKKRNLA